MSSLEYESFHRTKNFQDHFNNIEPGPERRQLLTCVQQ